MIKANSSRVGRDILRHALGFPGFHTLNAILGLAYTVVQTVILARTLDQRTYAQTVAMTAVSFYILPINQAVARAGFLNLREMTVGGSARAHRPEASTIFHFSQAAMFLISIIAPLFVCTSWLSFFELAGYTLFTTLSMMWFFEIQMVMLAIDKAMRFERISLLRRMLCFGTLATLFLTRNFLLFGIMATILSIATHLWAVREMASEGLLGRPKLSSLKDVVGHFRSLTASIQATFGEWVTLNAPYAIFTARYGVGPPLIALDATLKVLRFVLSVTRNVCEIVLPRLSKDIINGKPKAAIKLVGAALGLCVAMALVVGGLVLAFETRCFSLLLGPNNVVPRGAGAPVAISILAGVVFQVGSLIVGFFAQKRTVAWFTLLNFLASGALAAGIYAFNSGPLKAMWFFAVDMGIASIVALVAMTFTVFRFAPTTASSP